MGTLFPFLTSALYTQTELKSHLHLCPLDSLCPFATDPNLYHQTLCVTNGDLSTTASSHLFGRLGS